MAEYVYTALDNPGSQIRLLTIPFRLNKYRQSRMYEPLNAKLSHHYLPSADFAPTQRLFRGVRLPAFTALSYVWGDPTLSHEIFIDGRRLLITANLHALLWRLHIDSITDIKVWADAICINQEDLAERSAQIQLMRQVYHLASFVKIWLGTGKRETSRCMQFIACITGSSQAQISRYLAKEEKANPDAPISGTAMSNQKRILGLAAAAVGLPLVAAGLVLGVVARAVLGLAQPVFLTADVLTNDTQDARKTLILSSNATYQEIINELIAWQPTARALRAARSKEADFGEVAQLINRWLISRPEWFTRMWVVQEVGAASNVFIQCGRCSVTWTSFLRTVCYLHYTASSPVNDISRVTGLEQIHTAFSRGMRPPLQHLLQECQHRRSTDPRDKIYAILGLMGDPMDGFLQPDYSKPVSEVYADVARHFISQTDSLNPICGQQTQGRREDLPSWVPDFQLDHSLAPAPLVDITGSENIFFASGSGKRSKYSLIKRNRDRGTWSRLHTRGLFINSIASISFLIGPAKDRSTDSPQRRWHRILVIASSLLESPQGTNKSLVEFATVLSEYVKFLDAEDPPQIKIKRNMSTEGFTKDLYSITSDDIVAAYIRTLLCGRLSAQERPDDNDIESFLSNFRTRSPAEPWQRFCTAFDSGIRRRRLFITENGHMGAGPGETQPGDLVCVLFGCSVPVILHQEPDESRYRLIGECYLDRFMDGEAITELENGRLTLREFILK